VRGLDLESIIQFNKCEVLVYMDESKKPPVGQGLNKPAQVTLLNVKCVDKKTGQHYSDGPEVEKFEKRLKNKTEKQGAEFISYSALKGEWKFQVQHFSRFGLDVDSDEEDGIPQSDQQKAFHSSGMDMMEGVEEGTLYEDLEDTIYESPQNVSALLTNTGDDIEEESEEVLIEELQTIAPQPALPHSLPAHLGLDPLKMQQMRALFFADGEEAEDIALPGKFGQQWARQSAAAISDPASNLKHLYRTPVRDLSIEEGEDQQSWPQHLLHSAAGPSANQMRVSPHTSWRRSPAYTALEDKMSGQQSPSRSPVLALAMHAHEDGSTPKRPRGSGFWLEASNKSQSLATGRSDHIADAALFLGCSFRVGWGPNGVLVHSAGRVGQKGAECVLSSCIQFERVALDQTVRDEQGTVREELVQLQFIAPLTLHMSMSQVLDGFSQLATGHLRLRNLVCSPMELPRVCHEYEILTEKQHEVHGLRNADHVIIHHQAMVWRLTSVLFAEKPSLLLEDQGDEQEVISDDRVDPEAEPLIRRAKFSSWLQDSVSDLVKGELQQLKNGNEQQVKEIFTHLTGRQLDEAVEKAILRRDVRLSCLLAIAGGAVENRLDMASQLELWASEGLDQSLIEPDMMSIFRLLAGDLWGSLDGRGIDWKRFLGLVMWYQQPPDTDLPTIISSYEQFVRESRAPIPIPMYVEDRHIDDEARDYTNTYDSAYYLMLLHAKKEQPDAFDARKMLCPAAATYNWLDHQLAWHQESILRAVKALDTQELLHSLHMNFASQLLALGLCHWALYVVLHMPWSPSQPSLHEKVVKEILNQYCETWSSSEAQQQFLEYDLRIPSEWLHEALVIIKLVAQACFSDGMYSTCVVILPMIVAIEEIFIAITIFVHRCPVNSEVNCVPNLGGIHLFCHISFG
jgi:nuclear pore complex protein Nup98-Nup96